MDYREIVEEVESKRTGRKNPAKETTEKTLEKLDNPESNYKTVLIGGTNGKGSVVEMTSELLQQNGKKVGTYSSPHLKSVRERIQINGENISKKDFIDLYKEIESIDEKLSFLNS